MKRFARVLALGLLGSLAAAAAVGAATASDEERLRGRLAPEVAQQVLAIVASARQAGLPGDPLVARALEGASRRADAADIVADVRRQAAALASARDALAPNATSGEIVAGAGALLAGVPADTLATLRQAHPSGSLVIPIVVLCDFVARGVPVAAASSAVLTATRVGASDAALMRLRERIHERIGHGSPPAGATQDVLRQWLRRDPRVDAPAPQARTKGERRTP